MSFSLPEVFDMIQRRSWVRVTNTGAIQGIRIDSLPPECTQLESPEFYEVDLSANGAALRTEPPLPVNAYVCLLLKLDEHEEIEVPARVVRICTPADARPYAALSFVRCPENVRDRIARFLHHVQLQRRRQRTS